MRNLVRKLAAFSLAALLGVSLTGCGSTVDEKGYYNGGFWREHMRKYMAVTKRDMTNFYRTFDRHLMNYDWDDPTLD